MGRHCTICTSDHRKAIDLALLFHVTSYSRIATHFGVDETSLRRHERAHLAMSWELSKGLRAMLSSDNLLEQLGKWHERMENQYANADAAGNIMATVATARTGIAAIESFSHIGTLGELEQRVKALEAGKPPTDDDQEPEPEETNGDAP